ncbi:MAG: GTPase HflX [Candidatus Obscuribacterales bacterium]|nr:GTPase HflX [Candidatus Obscuribacterales bacterium]
MHGKLDLGRAKGLKQSEIKKLNRLLQKRIPKDKILTTEIADSIAEITHETGYAVSIVVNRRGQVVNVTVGSPAEVQMPELRGVRVGPGRLCGHRIISAVQAPAENGARAGKSPHAELVSSKESLQFMARNRLDLLAQVTVDARGSFSRSKGEQAKLADLVQVAHLLPGRDSDGKLWKILPAQTVRGVQEDNFEELISALEEEFRTRAPELAVAEGEERAFLIGLVCDGANSWQVEDDLDELARLARTAGATVCGRLTQTRQGPDPKFFLGSGKIQEVALLIQELGATLLVVDQELTPNQQRNIEEAVAVKVIDRTELILDIFAQRAQTKEGKLQVELAQLKYLYPRLIGKGQTLSRLGGGIGTRGPGETKLEIDRRRIREKITFLEEEAARIKSYRDVQRKRRVSEHLPVVALTGYTNSGKSTLLNALTKADVYTGDKLFATLDPTTRRTTLPDHSPVLISDTVGFIKKLPTSLVTAFRATLEEVAVADILLHVVDASHPNVLEHISSVHDVLSDLGAVDKPMITVLNKADRVRKEDLAWLVAQVPNPVIASATMRFGLGSILNKIQEVISEVCPERQKYSA